MHASNTKSYNVAKVLPLDYYRLMASAKYVIRCQTIPTNIHSEINLCSERDFPKRATHISSQRTLRTYTEKILQKSGINQR